MKPIMIPAMLLYILLSLFTIGGHASPWAMSYSVFTSGNGCKDQGTISGEIGTIASKGFQGVRIYSATDCSGIQNVGSAARASGLWMVVTIYISNTGIGAAQAQVDAMLEWAQWDLVKYIVFGNEAVHNGWVSASDLAGFISSSRSRLQAANYWGPIGTAETVDVIQNNAGVLCDVIDVVSANIQPFYSTGTSASGAGDFVSQQLDLLRSACPGKDAYSTETGWPTAGSANGAAVPGYTEQQEAISSIRGVAEGNTVFFSFEDELWKDPGNLGVEQHWGCIGQF
ncbi:MAG: hypothetical protein M1835_000894 [Candelina submexicana]|nr:MAG: hypothetical protein M1835_000894 [Candelina submexicana]